jgi:hypothetical protein
MTMRKKKELESTEPSLRRRAQAAMATVCSVPCVRHRNGACAGTGDGVVRTMGTETAMGGVCDEILMPSFDFGEDKLKSSS